LSTFQPPASRTRSTTPKLGAVEPMKVKLPVARMRARVPSGLVASERTV
jgi:hypothetical protein